MGQVDDFGCVARSDIVCLEGNGIRPSHKGNGWSEGGVMYTLNSTEVHAICFGISPYHSKGMLSSNPNVGFYEADTSRSLDSANCGYPACNQGGICVVEIHSTKEPSE